MTTARNGRSFVAKRAITFDLGAVCPLDVVAHRYERTDGLLHSLPATASGLGFLSGISRCGRFWRHPSAPRNIGVSTATGYSYFMAPCCAIG